MRSSSASRSASASASAILIAISLAAAAASAQQAPTLDQLLGRFRTVEGLECRFREEKRIALLTTPILSEGTVHYVRPGRLARRITAPAPQIVLVEGDSLRMSAGGRIESIDLAAQPVVRSFVDTFGQLLTGDRAALERSYRIEYAPAATGASWSMVLHPRAAPLDRFLREIRFEGEGTSLTRMVMTEVSGDVTTTTFSDIDVDRRFTSAERERIFSLR